MLGPNCTQLEMVLGVRVGARKARMLCAVLLCILFSEDRTHLFNDSSWCSSPSTSLSLSLSLSRLKLPSVDLLAHRLPPRRVSR